MNKWMVASGQEDIHDDSGGEEEDERGQLKF